MIDEKLLSFIWKNSFFKTNDVVTTEGESILIKNKGSLNKHGGPDFTHAKIRIANTDWIGSVELDLKKSFWQNHKHHLNKNYRNVILHVVWVVDDNSIDTGCPTLELKRFVPKYFLDKYREILNSKKQILCEKFISQVEGHLFSMWKHRLVIEKNYQKVELYKKYLIENKKNWEQTFFNVLARNFGLLTNGDAFLAMANSIPVNIFSKIKNSLFQIEALLFGQGCLLEENFQDEYFQHLKREYDFLAKKYGLSKPYVHMQFMKIRPYAFPTIRLAQLATLIYRSSHLFSKILEVGNVLKLKAMFDVSVSDYWKNHFVFDKESKKSKKNISDNLKNSIILNTVVPVLFLYAKDNHKDQYYDKAISFLDALPMEDNSIIKLWKQLEITPKTAFDSQALIHLYKNYCSSKRCLDCSLGYNILRG